MAFGIKPYEAFRDALKVRDQVDIALDLKLPASCRLTCTA